MTSTAAIRPSAHPAARGLALRRLQRAHRACTRCVEAGHLAAAHPVFSGHPGQRFLLVGQAPGLVEEDVERPFAGRAGRILIRWLVDAGFADEADVRRRVYITSTTTCFPGRRPGGSGDRRPTPAEVALCAGWLEGVLELLAPRIVITVGALALERLLPGRRRLDDAVGLLFAPDGLVRPRPLDGDARLFLPLPHPSGQSRWLNQAAHRRRLDAALARLGGLLAWADRPHRVEA